MLPLLRCCYFKNVAVRGKWSSDKTKGNFFYLNTNMQNASVLKNFKWNYSTNIKSALCNNRFRLRKVVNKGKQLNHLTTINRWYLLIPVVTCWYLLIPVDTCWYLFIPVDTCWYLINFNLHTYLPIYCN